MLGFGLLFQAGLLLQSGNCYSTTAGKLPFAPAIMTEGLKFLQLCLENSAGVKEEDRLTNKTLVPVSRYLENLHTSSSTCIDEYLDLLLQSLGPAGGGTFLFSYCVLDIITINFLIPVGNKNNIHAHVLNRRGVVCSYAGLDC